MPDLDNLRRIATSLRDEGGLLLARSLLAEKLRSFEEQLARDAPVVDDTSDEGLVAWAEKNTGAKLRNVPKVLAALHFAIRAFRDRKMLRMILLGPRGGGKTKLMSLIELIAYRFFGYSAQNLGGSFEQAQKCYDHIDSAHAISPDLRSFTVTLNTRNLESRRGDRIGISAASQTSVRGAHPIGSSGGGLLVLDEVALVEDAIYDAAQGMLSGASPSALVQATTMGEKQQGRFWELIQNPAAKGYTKFDYDCFDVAKRCQYDCKTTCPFKEHFAEDYYHDLGGGTKQFVHKAYCGGRAHDVDGWLDIDEIAQFFRENNRETFEREWLGWSASKVGKVYDPVLLDRARLDGKSLAPTRREHDARMKRLEKVVGLDWGFSGETAICYAVRLKDALVVYRWEFFTGERFQTVREHVIARCREEGIDTICPDAANPSDNQELHAMIQSQEWESDAAPRVRAVAFGKWKRFGVGEVRRRLEQGLLKFASSWGGEPVPGFERAVKYLRAYHTDKNGDPVKKDDHACDALLCACLNFARNFAEQPSLV